MRTKFLQALKIAGVGAIFALSGVGLPARAQQGARPPVGASGSSVSVNPKPGAKELERWRQTIVQTRRPKKGCFTAQYPATAWSEVPCAKPPNIPLLPRNRPRHLVGNLAGDAVAVVSGTIQWSEGSFDSVTGVTSECNAQCPKGSCSQNLACTSSDPQNDYSLQLNTNRFTFFGGCEKASGCEGWQQFVFLNNECDLTGVSPVPACAFIQYWLLGYGPNCPTGWNSQHDSFGDDCYINSQNSVNFLPFPLSDLATMKLAGAVAGLAATNDTVTFSVGAQVWSAPGDNSLSDLVENWTDAEFNVFGTANGSRAVFNSGTSMVVRIVAENETPNAPACSGDSTTLETNNLTVGVLQTGPTHAPQDISSTQPGNVATRPGGPGPALVFAQSNAPGVLSAGCAGAVMVAGGRGSVLPPPIGHGPTGGACTGKKCCESAHGKCTICVPSNLSCP
jgi:hypothetical protein